jgi:CBS domain-containing protein
MDSGAKWNPRRFPFPSVNPPATNPVDRASPAWKHNTSDQFYPDEMVMSVKHSVREFMTSPVSSLPSTAPLLDAALLLRSTHIRHIPIVDGETLVGILSDRDVQRCTPSRLSRVSAEEYNSIFQTTQVSIVMTREPRTISPDTTLQEAVTILRSGKLGCLPVVENGKLIGIITKDDMLAALLHLLNGSPAIR